MAVPPLNDYGKYTRMARWFNPVLLFRLLQNVILSTIFGSYADRRLVLAALDNVPLDDLYSRATAFKQYFQPTDGAVWLDFVADLGDGFDSTYAVASLLAEPDLEFNGEHIKKGQVLVMGGDEVYPLASGQAYRNQLRQPYAWASPDPGLSVEAGAPLIAIPGNHDWYDGLDLFLALFCRNKSWHIGSWRTHQRRSYFAVQITDGWWLWATDVQLADNMDQPQADYFSAIAHRMPENSKIILCSAEPGWLYTHTNRRSWGIVEYAIWIAEFAGRGLTVPVLLSGDTHHYSRYSAADGKQFITSGGGGAFLHPTHGLENKVTLEWLGTKKELSLTTSPEGSHSEAGTEACFPSKRDSRRLVWRNLWFAIKNWDFSILMGIIYWIAGAALSLREHLDMQIAVAAIFAWAIIGYTTNQEKSKRPTVIITSALHAAAHVATVMYFTQVVTDWNTAHFVLSGDWYSFWKWLGILFIELGVVGAVIGSTIFGLNLLITCRWCEMNSNDAFSALRSGDYKNFLRLRIVGDKLDIFAVGLKKTPRRNDWVANDAHTTDPLRPVFIPKKPLEPQLIEKINIESRSASGTANATRVERVK